MARAIAFDYDQALERATRLFWKSGYAGTSLRDLLKVMDIGEGSFYNTLKSKKQLYLACAKHYEETEGRKFWEALMSAPTASQGVRALFDVVLDCLDDPSTPSRLCMLAAMASEDVLSQPDLRKFVEDRLRGIQVSLTERLNEDHEQGRLPTTLDPHITASVIVTYLQGAWRMALVDYKRPCYERQIDALLSGLGL
jgi:TetR/AcrR family transcriptional regulator, transcriptional repressor for nem operon